ncbi:MAG: hypothetical protein VXX85_05010 [Candidatus Margulisiibacteriota bacterium]|nr:hypothetical protein [Candidatus Margulisiibacteriota bacterium]
MRKLLLLLLIVSIVSCSSSGGSQVTYEQGTLSVKEKEALSAVNNTGYSNDVSFEISSNQTLTKEDVIKSIQNSIFKPSK